jgi:Flp pilus assembly protein TadD
MGSGQNPEAEKLLSQGRRFFLISYVFLLLMAFTWSLGSGFIYLFLAAGLFFIFLGVSRLYNASLSERSSFRTSGSDSKGFADWWYEFVNKNRNTFSDSAPYSTTSIRPDVKRVMSIIGFGFGLFIMLLIVIGIFSSDESETEYLAQGDNYYQSGNLDSAYLYYKRALREDEKSLAAKNGLGKVFNETARYDSALFYYDQVLSVDPEAIDGYSGKALAYFNLQRYDESLQELKLLLEKDESNSWGQLLSGDCYYLQKRYPEALPYYEKAYELGERSKELSNILAYIYDVGGNADKAVIFYEETLQYGEDAEITRRLSELKAQ